MEIGERYCRLSNKRPNARYGLPLLDLLVGGVSEMVDTGPRGEPILLFY